jgi:hypothetical protein
MADAMAGSETFVHEMEEKNLKSFERLLASLQALLDKEAFSPTDLVRLEMRAVIEATEVAALWLTDSDSLQAKLVLAAQCGDEARHFSILQGRLAALGIDPVTFDARYGGYSKLFAFFRSLQTSEERAAAGFLTVGAYNGLRLELLAAQASKTGDLETAGLFAGALKEDSLAHRDIGRQKLLETATAEESQARARRAAFRTIELLGDLQDGSVLRKYLSRSLAKR